MKINPLAVFTALTLATFGALVYVERNKTADEVLATTTKVEPLNESEPPKAVEAAPAAEAPKAAEPAANAQIVPSFDTVRVEPTGDAVIAGRAKPGSEVVVKFNGATVGTTTANADGAFVVTPEKPLPSGPGALSIESKSNEIVIASADSVAVDVKAGAVDTPLVAVLKPDAPTKVIQVPAAPKPALPPSETVNLDTVDYDQSGNIVFGGRGTAGSKVQIYVDNKAYGLADIRSDGTWTFAGLSPLSVGPHALRADEIGSDGTVKSRIEMPFYREEPAKVAAAPETVKPVEVAKVEVAPAATTTTDVAEVVAPAAPATVETSAASAEAPAVVAAQVPAAAEPVPEAAAAPTQIVIQPGNNLWKLSRKIYGKGIMYTVIYEANKDQIRKPSLIYPGQVFLTPEAAAATTGQ